MPATKITDLLPIPEGTREPHAYQIFGLEDGEQDRTRISEAIQTTIARMKAAKSSTDPKLWNKAARLVQESRVVLVDADKKAQLDARFGIIAIDDNPPPADSGVAESGVRDPLAAVLPAADDPLAAVLPTSNPLDPVPTNPVPAQTPQPKSSVSPVLPRQADHVMPPGVFGTPQPQPAPQGVASAPVAATTVPPAPVVVRRPKKRRRRPILGTLFFVAFTLGMFGVIGGLMYFLLYGPGQVAITSTNGRITIRTQGDEPGPRVSRPVVVSEHRRGHDPVMGNLGAGKPRPRSAPQPGGTDSPPSHPPTTDKPQEMDPQPTMDTPPTTAPPAGESSPSPGPGSDANQPLMATEPTEETTPPLTDEMIAEAEENLGRVRDLIRQAKWKEMKASAEAAMELPMTDQQRSDAEGLYWVADLATFYRGAIEQAAAELKVGNDFAVTDSFRVIIVETGEDLVVVRYNAKNQSFTLDELPFSMAHRLATFSLPDSPTTQAAKAVYQAIAPKATDAHRNESLRWLRDIDGQFEGADPKRLSRTIETLFGEDA